MVARLGTYGSSMAKGEPAQSVAGNEFSTAMQFGALERHRRRRSRRDQAGGGETAVRGDRILVRDLAREVEERRESR